MLATPLSAGLGSDSNRLQGLAVLVVEDDADSRELLCEFLGEQGATCLTAGSGNQGLTVFTSKRPDIVVSDLWMPDGDGFDLIRAIRALPPEQGGLTPAIAVSGGPNGDEKALLAGYHLLVTKPYDPDKVADDIREFLRTEEQAPSARTPWTVSRPDPGTVVIALAGFVGASDVKACIGAVIGHLEHQPSEVVLDLRQLTGFSIAAASVGQRVVWSHRHAIRRVRVVGGSRSARLVAAGACSILGVRCTFETNP